jgi:hypothetical protein
VIRPIASPLLIELMQRKRDDLVMLEHAFRNGMAECPVRETAAPTIASSHVMLHLSL